MVKILRKKCSVIAYSEADNRGIAFPKDPKVDVNDFITELQEIAEKCEEVKVGTIIVPLVFDSTYKENYRAMSKFLKDKKGWYVLKNKKIVRELYKFYFANSIPEFSPGGVNYIFLG